MSIKSKIGWFLYQTIGIRMPMSFSKFSCGSRRFRQFCAHWILPESGAWLNIEKGVHFAKDLKIGNGSGLGANSGIASHVEIGENVMTGPELLIYT